MAENKNEQQNGAQNYRLDAMPRSLRLVQYDECPVQDGMTACAAQLFHRHITLRVTWTCRQPDPRLHVGALVSIRWGGHPAWSGDSVAIARLVASERADENANPFDTVPPTWVANRNLVERGRALIHQLPRRFRHLFNAIFWNDHRFFRYVTVPAALQGGAYGDQRQSAALHRTCRKRPADVGGRPARLPATDYLGRTALRRGESRGIQV